MKSYDKAFLDVLPRNARAQLVNSLAGPRSAYLVGTQNAEGQTNLSMISSCVHLGSNPPLLAFVIRPRQSPRHSYDNILRTQHWTLNNVTSKIAKKAHQTSARYPQEISEFDAVDLKPQWHKDFPAPYVEGSTLQIGMRLVEALHLKVNGTELMIGEVKEWHTEEEALSDDGNLDLDFLGSLSVTGLDSYHEIRSLFRLSYAKTDQVLHEIELPRIPRTEKVLSE